MNIRLRRAMKQVLAVVAVMALLQFFNINSVFASSAGFTTESFNVNATVNENHTINMTETIKVDFQSPKHGVYRYIPYQSNIYKIKDIKVDGDNYELSTEYQNGVSEKIIQIGDADETITGKHTYEISYVIAGYKDNDENKDYFSLDVLPTNWETSIDYTQVTISMPKDLDWKAMKLYSGTYGSTDSSTNVNYNYDDKNNTAVITGKNIASGSGITLSSELKEGYWVGAADNTWVVLPMAIALGVIPLIAILLWLKWGRDPKIVKTVEFYAPEGMTPAEIGYIIDGTVDTQDMTSLIMYFAEKGYLTIKEYEKEKFELTKVKDLDESEKTFAKTFFNGIFSINDTVQMDNLPESFGEKVAVAKDQLKGYYTGKNRLFTRGSKVCRAIGCFLMLIPSVIAVLLSAYMSLQFVYALAAIPVFLVLAVGLIVVMVAFDKRESLGKKKLFKRLLLGVILIIISVGTAAVITGILTTKWWLAIEMVVAMVITYLFALLMNARTKKAAQWQGQILGFKNFIKSAELEKLKALVEEDPSYFYNVMPYAYVMGLSDKWIKKFSKIPTEAPNWYYGYGMGNGMSIFDIMWMNHMMRGCYHSMSTAMMPKIDTSDIGGGDIGGGFGGGGFSGGGFGGGGGGAW